MFKRNIENVRLQHEEAERLHQEAVNIENIRQHKEAETLHREEVNIEAIMNNTRSSIIPSFISDYYF